MIIQIIANKNTFQLHVLHYIDQLCVDAIIIVNGRNIIEMSQMYMNVHCPQQQFIKAKWF